MRGDSYITGAMVSAYSIRKTNTIAKLVCMVTKDVSNEGRNTLKKLFDEVIEVPYIMVKCKSLINERIQKIYEAWSCVSFTKWNMLSLTQYDKTIFIDADTIILSNMDELFELNAPAGTFSLPQAYPFLSNNKNNKSKKSKGKRGIYNPYLGIKHGQVVTREKVMKGLTKKSFVAVGTTMLLKPNKEDYENYKKMLKEMEPFGFKECYSMHDEQSIAYYYISHSPLREWHMIHQKYNFNPWKRNWLKFGVKPYIFHFVGINPWELRREKMHKEEWCDIVPWWQVVLAFILEFSKNKNKSDEGTKKIMALFNDKDLEDLFKWAKKEKLFCGHCMAFDRGEKIYRSHDTFNRDGILTCPYLTNPEVNYT